MPQYEVKILFSRPNLVNGEWVRQAAQGMLVGIETAEYDAKCPNQLRFLTRDIPEEALKMLVTGMWVTGQIKGIETGMLMRRPEEVQVVRGG